MKIVLELSDKDLQYFRGCLRKVRKGKNASDEDLVLSKAAELIDEVARSDTPEFVRERLRKLELLVDMLKDGEWRLSGPDRARVLNALAYFVDPDDLIPDRIPGIGYLDDAIMVELIVQELRHEIEAYEKFCQFRAQTQRSPEKTEERRVALQKRMRRNRRRELEVRRSRKTGRSPLSLW